MSGTQKVLFGKHNGKTYEEVLNDDKSYCEWLLSTKGNATSQSVLKFIAYIEKNMDDDDGGSKKKVVGKNMKQKVPVKKALESDENSESDDSDYKPAVKPIKKKVQQKALESESDSDVSDISDLSEKNNKNKKKPVLKKQLKALDTESESDSDSSEKLPKFKSKK